MDDASIVRSDGLPTIGLAVIAKNEGTRIGDLLDSVGFTSRSTWKENRDGSGTHRPDAAVDFVVVCDTGSDDATKQIAADRGCKVVDFEWCDDFSAARTASYDALPDVDFTLWADCDDVIVNADQLRTIAAQLPPQAVGTLNRYDYAQDPNGNCVCELWRERLVRKGIGEWTLPIHEVLRVPDNASLVHDNTVTWVHKHGADRERDPIRNYQILQRSCQTALQDGSVPDPRTLAYLGTEAMTLKDFAEAVEAFEWYLDHPEALWNEERCQIAHKLSISLRALNRFDEAEQAAFQALKERPDWADGYLDLAEIALSQQRPDQAIEWATRAQQIGKPDTMLIISPFEYEYQPLAIKAAAYLAKQDFEQSAFYTEQALKLAPQHEALLAQHAHVGNEVNAMIAEQHLLGLREILVRFDENKKANDLFQCVPYIVENRPAVAQARLDQREMTLHDTEPDVYGKFYREGLNEVTFEAHGIPIETAHEHFHRLATVRTELQKMAKAQKRKLADFKVLDLSSNCGWMGANLSDLGVGTVDLMDMNKFATDEATKRKKQYPGIGKVVCADLHNALEHFEAGSYDAVICFETIEHVPNPAKMLDVMDKLVIPSQGRCFVSTPAGAYENGNLPHWWHVEHKGHLRALTPEALAELVVPRGIVETMDVVDGVCEMSWVVRPRRGKIVFFAGGVDPLPEQILGDGMGGSETALAKLAEHFARKEYDVRVYAGHGGGLRGDHISVGGNTNPNGQVLYCSMHRWNPGERCDLFVSSRVPEVFDRSIAAEKSVLWLHDAEYGDRLTEDRIARTDAVLVMSEFQKKLLSDNNDALKQANIVVTRNGIETDFYSPSPTDPKKPWVVYSSSPDRGLDVLLEVWPEVVKQVPDAQLHHTYAPVYQQFKERYPHLKEFHAHLEALSADLTGVVPHTHLNQQELADLFLQARVWAYPSWNTPHKEPFPEISCISAMEAQAAGCVPVFHDYGALKETVACGLPVETDIEDDKLSEKWRSKFVEYIVEALTDDKVSNPITSIVRAEGASLDWKGVADQWQKLFLAEPE